jgi:hypothetical protein
MIHSRRTHFAEIQIVDNMKIKRELGYYLQQEDDGLLSYSLQVGARTYLFHKTSICNPIFIFFFLLSSNNDLVLSNITY